MLRRVPLSFLRLLQNQLAKFCKKNLIYPLNFRLEIDSKVKGKETISVAKYFLKKGIKSIDASLPGIRAEGPKDCVFPLECIMILENQRLPLTKMSDQVSRDLLQVKLF